MAGMSVQTFAAERFPLQELIDSEIFDKEGSEYTREAYQSWLDQALPEVLANKILNKNFAFVPDSDCFWNYDRKETMPQPAIWSEDKIQIPSSVAEKIFGISVTKPYISVNDIVQKLKDYKLFVDPRGFALITKDMSVIDKAPCLENNIGGRHYRSYYDVSCCIAELTWKDAEADSAEFAKIRKRIADSCTMNDDSFSEQYLQDEINATKTSMSYFNKSGEAPIFAADSPYNNQFAWYQQLYQWGRTHYMLKKFGRNDIDLKELKRDFILLAKYLYDNDYGCNASINTNWYFNRISYPMFMGIALDCMYDELPKEDLIKYANTMLVRAGDNLVGVYCVPFKYYTNGSSAAATNAYSNYTNLIWQTFTNYVLCAVAEDSVRANHTIKFANQAFETVKNGADVSVGLLKDGVYEDGSFVFHAWYAYNLGYGKSYACCITDLAEITAGTVFDVKKSYGFEHVYSWIEKSWLPFIQNNWLTHIVQGRETPNNNGAQAKSIVTAIILLASESGNEKIIRETAQKIKPIMKGYETEYRNFTTRLPNFSCITYPNAQTRVSKFIDYMESLPETEAETYSNVYYNMDKIVHKGTDYKFMLSMASNRIDRYEAINAEGYTDWYESDGMTYNLLESDNQYLGDWWGYVDRYKLPGTTADEDKRNPAYSSYGTVMPNNTWAGAATDGKVTVASQQLTGNAAERTKKLGAWKSWFMLDDKIVCLGTGIKGGKGTVATTVENILLSKKPGENAVKGYDVGYEEAVIDGETLPVEFDIKKEVQNPSWAWLESNRGFLFMGENKLVAERAAEDKAFAGLSAATKNQDRTKPFMTLYLDHGQEPKNGSYAYAILPNVTKKETRELAENPGFEILEQSDSVHAIREMKSGKILASVMKPGVNIDGFEFLTPCCVVLEPESNGSRTVYIADANQTEKTVKVVVPGNEKVTSEYLYNRTDNTVEIQVDRYYGKTYSFTYGGEREQDSFVNSPDIVTSDLTLRCGKGVISTGLHASDLKNEGLTYSIITPPETGKAIINGDRLYFIPDIFVSGYENVIVIEAENKSGDRSRYKIKIYG